MSKYQSHIIKSGKS